MLTQDQIKILSNYTEHFRNARHGFCRGVYRSEVDQMLPIYESCGKVLSNSHCASCILEMIKYLADEYEKNLKNYEDRKKRNTNTSSKRAQARGKNDANKQRVNKNEVKTSDN